MTKNQCEYIAACIFYNDKMPSRPKTEDMKRSFCEKEFTVCARFKAAKEAGCVSLDLYPDGITMGGE